MWKELKRLFSNTATTADNGVGVVNDIVATGKTYTATARLEAELELEMRIENKESWKAIREAEYKNELIVQATETVAGINKLMEEHPELKGLSPLEILEGKTNSN